MYTATDIKKRIDEMNKAKYDRQMEIFENAVAKMYDCCLTRVEVSMAEGLIDTSVKARLADAGFEVEDLGDGLFRLYIAEEE